MADILYLVERLEQVLAQGWRVPFTTNAVIDEDAFIDVIEQTDEEQQLDEWMDEFVDVETLDEMTFLDE